MTKLSERQIITEAWERGHFWNPDLPEGLQINQQDLQHLRITDKIVMDALRSYSMADPYRYTRHVVGIHGRRPWFDGVAGPAMQAMMLDKGGVCPVPDYAPPPGVEFFFADPDMQQIVSKMQREAMMPAGSGQWKGCHGVGDFHAAKAVWDLSGLPSFLEPHFAAVLSKVREAFAQMGLLWHFVDGRGKDLLSDEEPGTEGVNTYCSFRSRSDGWIGLAILGGQERCNSQPIWARFLNTFRGGNTAEQWRNQWWSLIMHELMHNLGRRHVAGGIMNPSLVFGLPMTLVGDTSEGWARQQFGGKPVPISDEPEPPPNPPQPPDDVQRQIDKLRMENLIQQALIDELYNSRC